jgi:transposase-like protein
MPTPPQAQKTSVQTITRAEKQRTAVDRRQGGHTIAEIADELGVDQRTILRWIDAHVSAQVRPEHVDELRRREAARVDRAVMALWPRARGPV